MKQKHIFLLLFLPVIYLVFEYFKLPLIPHYYSTNPDPTYIYLMNGLNIASGNWELGHYDNPGTPLHVLTGLLLRIVHLFAGKDDITQDVIARPEFYIKSCVSILIFIKAIALYFVGYKISRHTNNLLIGITFQLIPLFIIMRLQCPGLIHPDILLDILCLLFVAYLFPVLYKEEIPRSFSEILRLVIPLSIIVGALSATKISSVGLVFIPFFVFTGWRSKALYLILGVAFFYFFTLPIFSRLDEFLEFITGIATHKGQYGQGEVGFIEFADFKNNIYRLYSNELTLPITFFISLIGGVFFSIKKASKWSLLLIGISITYLFQTIIVGKHYSYHYSIPLHYLFIISLFALIKLLKDASSLNWIIEKKWISYIMLAVFISVGGVRAFSSSIFAAYDSAKMLPTDSFLANRDQPTLFFPGKNSSFLTSSYVQPAFWFGKGYSGYTTRWDRGNELDSIYPFSYFYNYSFDIIEDWNEMLPLWMICKQHNNLDIYIRNKSEIKIEEIVNNQLEKYSLPKTVISLNEIYENKESGEAIYQMNIDKEWFLNNFPLVYEWKETFDQQSEKELFVKKDCKDPQQITSIEILSGDFITVSIWRKCTNKKCFIELRGVNGEYYHTGHITGRKDNWEKITLTHEVPSDYQGIMNITVRNASRGDASFDDLEISIFRKK